MKRILVLSLFTCILCSCSPHGSSTDFALLIPFLNSSNQNPRTYRYLFVTGSHNGNFGGPSGADNFCNSQIPPELSGTSNYKAALVDQTNRGAALDAIGNGLGRFNWVFGSSVEYRRADGVKVFTTNSSGIYDFLAKPLNAPFSTIYKAIWTSLSTDWSTANGLHCNSWGSASNGLNAELGDATATNVSAIHAGGGTCDQTTNFGGVPIGLLCVEQ
ncbi:hypothetical protein CH373_15800 [Leptospira perolatii]|uniref:DUF1554 domain-containing protein n=1 Tax=Leptospira perolatii TaxID=2023191 RepID=A0A2M9ZJR7_9LEPT|nr:DUF1554 domain-containing protein [Leptospira perolatii]PJZ68872.1 hypothetical protein CH360_14260 [Leptospira perolatii]PJZ72203.1 hypothetical protein CH373_15800 [Leptospira perolatii]